MIEIKCLVLGDNGPTKEAFLERVLDMVLVFYTRRGPICFNVCDAAGESNFEMLRKEPRIPAECAFILYDNEVSCHGDIRKILTDKATIICGHKKNLKDY